MYYEDWASGDIIYRELCRHPIGNHSFISSEQRPDIVLRASKTRAQILLNIQNSSSYPLINESYEETIAQAIDNNDQKRIVIYCDPPYRGTAEYKEDGFPHTLFWARMKKLSEEGWPVVVSEYTAPRGWEIIWENTKRTNSKQDKKNFKSEKLFVHESFFKK